MKERIDVLIVDDEQYVRDSLSEVLQAEGMRAATAPGARAALELLAKKRFDVIVTDLRMDQGDGLELLEEAGATGVSTPILVITGMGTVEDAVRAMKAGAHDFLQKPVDPDELALLVRRAARHRELAVEVDALRRALARLEPERKLVGASAAMEGLRADIARAARGDAALFVSGETGSGKELVAAEVHRASARAARPFVVLDCAALDADNFAAALYGTREGPAGVLAQAGGGTLVLDRVDELERALQPALARLVETGAWQAPGSARARSADVRWIATSRADARELSAAGMFLPELALVLGVVEIPVPPLREHIEDLRALAEHFVDASRARLRLGTAGAPGLDADALEMLAAYGWPGNVRELANVIERATLLAQGGALDGEIVRAALEVKRGPRLLAAGAQLNLRSNLDRLERELVLRAVAHTRGKKREACELLGIDARNLGYYLRKHKIGDAELRRAGGEAEPRAGAERPD